MTTLDTRETVADTQERVLMISSDGHATARMDDYKPYMPPAMRDEFNAFCDVYREKGARLNEERSMVNNFDKEFVDIWRENVLSQNRLEGTWDVEARFAEMARGGLAAEVIFADFGIPFELYNPGMAAIMNYRTTPEQREAGYFAFNRWLADWVSVAPHRFAGQALISFRDVDAALKEIRWIKEHGLRGIVLPRFGAEFPVFHPKFEPIWSLCEELQIPVNSHSATSGTFDHAVLPSGDDEIFPAPPPMPHRLVFGPLIQKAIFYSMHQLLVHFVWGGILENHPNLQFVLTEGGSAWTVGLLEAMDYTWTGAFTPREVRTVVKRPPSEYFHRQCHLGSSVFSLAEIQNRHRIGIDRMTIGMDFPHPEGTWGMGPGHLDYLNATLGVAKVPADEARLLLGENAVKLWGFDRARLQPVVDEHGKTMSQILKVPDADYFPRGDVHKPFGEAR
jgi:predicted TIM-barrel fold metal-dependent hydrolase